MFNKPINRHSVARRCSSAGAHVREELGVRMWVALGYLDSGRSDGTEVGKAATTATLFSRRSSPNEPNMKVVREEIFGPVVCAIPFDSRA
jgi:acyl-CoA reductase-like NAD-dependent aldehyde dehydrogenase